MNTRRMREIINILMHETDYISVSTIANKLDCSVKTIRNELNALKAKLKPKDAKIESVASKGVKLVIINKKYDIHKLDIFNAKSDAGFQAEDRVMLISLILLLNGSINRKKAIKKLFISTSTFNTDIVNISEFFSKFKIKIVRKQNNDMEIIAKERYIRACLLDLFAQLRFDNLYPELLGNPALLSNPELLGEPALLGNPALLSDKTETCHLKQRWNLFKNSAYYDFISCFVEMEEDIATILDMLPHLHQFFTQSFSHMPMQSISNMSVIVLISIIRIKNAHYVDLSESFIEYLNDFEFRKVQKACFELCDYIEEKFEIPISNIERLYIQFYFMTLGRQVLKSDLESNDATSAHIMEYIFYYFKQHYRILIAQDRELTKNFEHHISKLVIRLSHNIKIDNPNKEMIISTYRRSYEIAKNIMSKFEGEFDTRISEDELAHIAVLIELAFERHKKTIHCLLICLEDINIANLIKTKLINSLPNINVDLLVDINLLSSNTNLGYDIILSTREIKQYNWDYLVINSILTKADIDKIKEKAGL